MLKENQFDSFFVGDGSAKLMFRRDKNPINLDKVGPLFGQGNQATDQFQDDVDDFAVDEHLAEFDELERRGLIIFKERLEKNQYLEFVSSAHAVLVFLDRYEFSQGRIPTKLFDYMMFQKPVLGMLPEGEALNLIKETNMGIVATPEEKDKLKEAILDFYRKYRNSGLDWKINEEKMKLFERRHLTERLSDIFKMTHSKRQQ